MSISVARFARRVADLGVELARGGVVRLGLDGSLADELEPALARERRRAAEQAAALVGELERTQQERRSLRELEAHHVRVDKPRTAITSRSLRSASRAAASASFSQCSNSA